MKADRRERGNTLRSNLKRVWRQIKSKFSREVEVQTTTRIKLGLIKRTKNKINPESDAEKEGVGGETEEQGPGSKKTSGKASNTPSGPEPEDPAAIAARKLEARRAAMGVVDTDEPKEESPPLHIIIPRKMPKWRMYKLVVKYVEVGDQVDDDVDDDILTVSKSKRKKSAAPQEVIDVETLSNLRFRRAVYKVILLFRKEKSKRLIQKYIAIKQREMKMTYLGTVPSKASKVGYGRK